MLAQIFARFDGDESGELDLAELRDSRSRRADARGENEAVLGDAVMRHGARGDAPRGLTLGGLDIAYAAMGGTALFKDVQTLGLLDRSRRSVSTTSRTSATSSSRARSSRWPRASSGSAVTRS